MPSCWKLPVSFAVVLVLGLAGPARADDADGGGGDTGVTDVVDAARPLVPLVEHLPAPKLAESAVAIGERRLCVVRLPRMGIAPPERARRATQVLEQALESGAARDVSVAYEGAVAVVRIGGAPLLQLTSEDATAAGDSSVSIHAEACATAIRDGLRTELRRRQVANVVFSLSLIVLSGLLSFLLLGVVSRLAQRVTALVETRETLPALRVGNLELLTPAAIRVAASTAISIAKPVVQVVIVTGWVLSSMSLFPVTQALGRRATGYVLVPLTTFLGRIGAALPLLVLVALGAFALAVLLRFLRVFFASVAQGGIHLAWLPPRQALPASAVARVVAILGALLAAAPLLSSDGGEWGALRIVGVALTAAVVLALVPALANAALGTGALSAGHYPVGALVEVGAHAGTVVAVTLTHVHLRDRSGAEVRVPHAATLLQPVRVLGELAPVRYEVLVDARVPQGAIRKALHDAVRRQGRSTSVELTEIEGDRAQYVVVALVAAGEEDLASAIADALTLQSIAFARIRKLDQDG